MNLTLKYWLFLSCLCLLLNLNKAVAQSYVADTIVIPNSKLIPTDSLQIPLVVNDQRDEGEYFLSLFEKKKWLFFPVDQVVITEKPLSTFLEQSSEDSMNTQYLIRVHNYYIRNSESMTKQHFNLDASFEFLTIDPNKKDTLLLGSFYYEEYSKQKKKDSLVNGYAHQMNESKLLLDKDIQAVINGLDTTASKEQYHFRRGYPIAKKNFYVYGDAFAGINFWGFDVELNFSSPEPAQKFKRKSRMLRFMNFENRQSVAIARNVNYFNYRLSEKWLFQNKHAFLLGFNRWNDIDESKRTFEEIFLFQLTATQKITYDPIDKSSLVFGLGLMEDFSYIIYNKPMLNLAIVANIGFKF